MANPTSVGKPSILGFLALLCLGATLQCGGSDSGGRPALTGLAAAAGAPLIGTVTLKDSGHPGAVRTAPIAPDGTFRLETGGLAGPFMVQANGVVGVTLYRIHSAGSAADLQGTLNVTPLTDLILATVTKGDPAAAFQTGDFTAITPDTLAAQAAAVGGLLAPVLAALKMDPGLDLLHTPFKADHTGQGALSDWLSTTVDGQAKVGTLLNLSDLSTVQLDLASGAATGGLTGDALPWVTAGVQSVADGFNRLNALFATSVPTAQAILDANVFAPVGFLEDGRTLPAFLAEVLKNKPVGFTYDSLSLDAFNPFKGGLSFNLLTHEPGGPPDPRASTWYFSLSDLPPWLCGGNQNGDAVQLTAIAQYDPWTNVFRSGLELSFRSVTTPLGDGGHVRVQCGGLDLSVPIQQGHVGAAGSFQVRIWLTDDQITALGGDNTLVNVTFFDASDHWLINYPMTLPKAPPLASILTSTQFCAPSGTPLKQGLPQGGTARYAWQVPYGLTFFGSEYAFANAAGPVLATCTLDPSWTFETFAVAIGSLPLTSAQVTVTAFGPGNVLFETVLSE